MKVYLLRHGTPEFPDGRTYIYGQTDLPLSRRGLAEAERAGEALARVEFDRIFSSDLSRAVTTAEIVRSFQARAVEIEMVAGLREIHMGDWENRPKEEIAAECEELFDARGKDIANVAAPRGETFAQLRDRASAAFGGAIERSADAKNVLVASHGGVMWAIMSSLFGLDLGGMFGFALDFCGVHVIERTKRGWRLIRYNWTPDVTGFEGIDH